MRDGGLSEFEAFGRTAIVLVVGDRNKGPKMAEFQVHIVLLPARLDRARNVVRMDHDFE